MGIFLFDIASRTVLGPTQPPIQWVPGSLSLGVKRPGCEADHSPSSSAEVKECVELYIYSSNTPLWRGAQFKKSTGATLGLPCWTNGLNWLYWVVWRLALPVLNGMKWNGSGMEWSGMTWLSEQLMTGSVDYLTTLYRVRNIEVIYRHCWCWLRINTLVEHDTVACITQK